MHLLGQFTAEVQHNLTKTTSTFLVTKENNTCLLSYNTSTGLGLLNININSITIDHSNPRIAQILQQHHKVFQGMGNLKNCEVKLEINPTVTLLHKIVDDFPTVCEKSKRKAQRDGRTGYNREGRWSDPMAITTHTHSQERRRPSTCPRHESPQPSARETESSITYRR